MNIHDLHHRQSGAPALRDGRGAMTSSELCSAASAIAEWLRAFGCGVVALLADNCGDWVVVDLACQMADLVLLPIPPFFSAAQAQHCLRSAGAELLLTDAPVDSDRSLPVPFAPRLRALRLPRHETSALPVGTSKITFTSGSTGEPKGVCLSAELQWRVADSLATVVAAKAPRHLCLLPLATLLENVAGVYAPLLSGGEIILPDAATRGLSGSSGLDLRALLRCIDAARPHSMILLPQLLRALVGACEQGWNPPSSLRFVAVGGARISAELVILARRCGIPVYEGYGLSECGSVVALNAPAQDRLGSVGCVLPHCSVDVDDGELVVTGASHLGYVGEPGSWHPRRVATGDLGTVDTAGFVRVSGRKKSVLISSYGRNISPEWVESELLAQPLLSHCAVVGEGRPFLSAVIGAPDAVGDERIEQWLVTVNRRLPDYARVGAWLRLEPQLWAALLTPNGRPRRADIERVLAADIEQLYAPAAAGALADPT